MGRLVVADRPGPGGEHLPLARQRGVDPFADDLSSSGSHANSTRTSSAMLRRTADV